MRLFLMCKGSAVCLPEEEEEKVENEEVVEEEFSRNSGS